MNPDRHPANVPLIWQCIGFRLDCINSDIERCRNMLSLMDEGNVQGTYRSMVETMAAKLRVMADELESLAGKVQMWEAAE